jgi:hypothetical protein
MCGKPGYVQQHPNAPMSACWCDECIPKLARSATMIRAALVLALCGAAGLLLWIASRIFS